MSSHVRSRIDKVDFLKNDSHHLNERRDTFASITKLDTFVLLTNEGPSLDKKDDQWNEIKDGDDGMSKGNKNGVTSDDFRTLKPP